MEAWNGGRECRMQVIDGFFELSPLQLLILGEEVCLVCDGVRLLLQIVSFQGQRAYLLVMSAQKLLGPAVTLANLCIELRELLFELLLKCLMHTQFTILHHLADLFYHSADSVQLGLSVFAERLNLLILHFMRVFDHFLELLFIVASRSFQGPLDLINVIDQAIPRRYKLLLIVDLQLFDHLVLIFEKRYQFLLSLIYDLGRHFDHLLGNLMVYLDLELIE